VRGNSCREGGYGDREEKEEEEEVEESIARRSMVAATTTMERNESRENHPHKYSR